MPVDTRRTQYSIPDLPDDTDMDESPKALALPAPTTPEHQACTAVQVIAPEDHHTPTTIHAYNPPTDLESIIASIPAQYTYPMCSLTYSSTPHTKAGQI